MIVRWKSWNRSYSKSC